MLYFGLVRGLFEGVVYFFVFGRGGDGFVDVEVDAVGVVDDEAALAPGFVDEVLDDIKAFRFESAAFGVDVVDLEGKDEALLEEFALFALGLGEAYAYRDVVGDEFGVPVAFDDEPEAEVPDVEFLGFAQLIGADGGVEPFGFHLFSTFPSEAIFVKAGSAASSRR
jgi:hypothetical protein